MTDARASRRNGNFGPPMSLANMRQNGVRAVIATCETCGHVADVNVNALAETVTVPEVGRRFRCGQCGGKLINTRPAWHTAGDRWGSEHQGLWANQCDRWPWPPK